MAAQTDFHLFLHHEYDRQKLTVAQGISFNSSGVFTGFSSSTIGFFNVTPVARQNVNLTSPTLQSVIDALVLYGLLTQSDT